MGRAQASPVRGLLCKTFSKNDLFLTRTIPDKLVEYPLQFLDLIGWWARDDLDEVRDLALSGLLWIYNGPSHCSYE